jgi:UDP-3-O-[3-hydroxymyristoyl] N-acetylglucosamine deacetylase
VVLADTVEAEADLVVLVLFRLAELALLLSFRYCNSESVLIDHVEREERNSQKGSYIMQRTIKRELSFTGIGLHTGAPITVSIRPAQASVGIQFIRSDLRPHRLIAARPSSVLDTKLATRIGSDEASSISTIEHFLAALYGFGIDNLIVEVGGPEMPIFDGSAAPFLTLLDEAGIVEISGSSRQIAVVRRTIECLDPKDPSRFIRIEPSKVPEIHYAVDFGQETPIGMQSATMQLDGFSFCEHYSYARTFCFADEVAAMQRMGLARGGSLDNAIVVSREGSGNGVLNQHGLRDSAEFVKHKILDCIGDMMLVGCPVVGRIVAHKAGHDLHTRLASAVAEAMVADSGDVEVVMPKSWSRAAAAVAKSLRHPKSLGEITFAPGSTSFRLVTG